MRYAFLLIFAICAATMSAQQTTDEQKKEINRIKKSADYLYGEATLATEDEAKDLAEELLYNSINEYCAKNKKLKLSKQILINNIKGVWDVITMPRGNMVRAFYYVKKKDLQGVDNTQVMTMGEAGTSDYSVTKADAQSTLTSLLEADLPIETKPDFHPVAKELSAITNGNELMAKVKDYLAAGKIKAFKNYADIPNPESYYIIIFDKTQTIKAILSPGKERFNVATGKPDGVQNYKGCGGKGMLLE